MAIEDGDITRVDYTGDYNSADQLAAVYQFNLLSGGPLTNEQALDDFEDIFIAIWNIVKALHDTLVIFRRLRAQAVPSGILLGDQTFAAPQAGTSVEDVSSTTVTAPVSFKTIVPRVILRKSIGPIAENQINATGHLAAGGVATLSTFAALMMADHVMTNGTWEYGYFSPKTAAWEVPVTALITDRPGTLSRRRLGRGA